MNIRIPENIVWILLGIWLILTGLNQMGVHLDGLMIVVGLLGIITGILFLLTSFRGARRM